MLRPASEWTLEALSALNLSEEGSGATLLLPDNLLLSTEFLRDFLSICRARPGEGALVAALGPGEAARRSEGRSLLPPGPDGSLPVPLILWRRPDGVPETLEDLLAQAAQAESVVVPARETTRDVPVPRAYADEGRDSLRLAASPHVALHLSHRSHLLQANLEMLGRSFLAALGRPRWLLALRYLWERFRPGPRRLFSRIGRGCRIHPTALVEASVLGEGCEIGAHAIVRASVLGSGVTVEDGAHVHACILGPQSRIGRQTAAFASVLMESAHSTQQLMQVSVLGRHAATTSSSWFLDARLDGSNVRVESPSGLLDAGTRFLGCDVGHCTVVGAGVLVAPGRLLPSNATVVVDPRQVASKLDSELSADDAGGAVLAVRNGRLESL